MMSAMAKPPQSLPARGDHRGNNGRLRWRVSRRLGALRNLSRPAQERNRAGRIFSPSSQIEELSMKRILLALAGYAFYRWWNSQPAQPAPPSSPPKRTPPRREPVNPG
jgi:hypothetical protein